MPEMPHGFEKSNDFSLNLAFKDFTLVKSNPCGNYKKAGYDC